MRVYMWNWLWHIVISRCIEGHAQAHMVGVAEILCRGTTPGADIYTLINQDIRARTFFGRKVVFKLEDRAQFQLRLFSFINLLIIIKQWFRWCIHKCKFVDFYCNFAIYIHNKFKTDKCIVCIGGLWRKTVHYIFYVDRPIVPLTIVDVVTLNVNSLSVTHSLW